ncbi:MAG: hypothetical protein GY898_32805 [Proteobacteria bacterium]|nr:hypothetical protein [Pseudomonadota bacterium]
MRILLPLLLLAVGCRAPDPAPEELSGLLQFAWSHYDLEEPTNDVSLADAGVNFATWFDEEVIAFEDYDVEIGFGGTLTEDEDRLPDDILADLIPAPEHIGGAEAAGVVVAIQTDCTLADIDRIYTIDDQLSLYPDNYISYERTDTANYDCFVDGTCEEMEWVSNISNQLPLNVTATFRLQNFFRRIEAVAPDGTEINARLGRTWMREEATMDPASIGKWFQNYQMEYLLENEDGVLHVYPQWVEVQLGEINTEANAFLNSYLDGLREYILALEEHCNAE